MKLLSLGWTGALLLCGLGATTAHADFDFTFSDIPSITAASANPPGTANTITNGLTLSGVPAATFSSAAPTGTSSIIFLGRNTSSSFDASFSPTFQFMDVTINSTDTVSRQYSLNFDTAFTLADPTPESGPGPQTIHFLGKLTGTIGGGSPSVSFSSGSFNPFLFSGPEVTAGDGIFHVILSSANDPTGLGAPGGQGHLGAQVTAAPEPTAAATFAVVGGLLALGRRRSRNAARK